MPAVFALVGTWMEAAPDGTVNYGGQPVPRSRFVSWAEAREMAASGLAEFASHSYDMHREVRGNPQGSMLPAAGTWAYDPTTGTYENDAALRARVRRDLERAIRLMRTNLGRTPRALVWPFGRTSGPALAAARDAGFTFALNLEEGPADPAQPMSLARMFPAGNPRLPMLAEGVRFSDPAPVTRRVICLSLDAIARGDAAARDAALGTTIEAVRALGANTVVLDPAVAAPAGGAMGAVYFPTRHRPLAADFLSFAAWQLRSRAGVEMFLRADLRAIAAAVGPAAVPEVVQDMVRVAPIDGLLIDPPGALLAAGSGARIAPYSWTIRATRDTTDAAPLDGDGRLALAAWRAAIALRPRLRLALAAPAEPPGAWPTPAADWLLAAPPADNVPALARRLAARGWLAPDVGPRLVLPLPADDPRAATRAMRAAQVLGATAFGLCPAPLPADPALAATFSAATFPLRP
jgi:hypothetical protein